jgi:hypothetical protein
MWFAVALLGFSLVYGVGRSLARHAPEPNSEAPLPGHAQVLGLASAIALCTFLVRTVQPVGTDILNMQLCFFSQYILLFGVGVCAWRRNWLLRIPYRLGMRWLTWALTAGSVAWLATILAGHLEGCFVDPASGNLALTSAATGALGQGVPLADVPEDICRRPPRRVPEPRRLGAREPRHGLRQLLDRL